MAAMKEGLSWKEMEEKFPGSTVMWDHQEIVPADDDFFFYVKSVYLHAENHGCVKAASCDCRSWNGEKWTPLFTSRFTSYHL